MTISITQFFSSLTSSVAKILHGFKQKKPVTEVYCIEQSTITVSEPSAIHLHFLRFQGDQIGRDKNNSYTVTIPMGYSIQPSDIVELIVVQEGEDYNHLTDIIINDSVVISVHQFLIGLPNTPNPQESCATTTLQ